MMPPYGYKHIAFVLIAVVIMFAALVCFARPARAEHYTDAEVSEAVTLAAANRGVSRAYLRCVIGYETGWTFDVHVVGRAGELGLGQLHPRGLLPVYYDMGYRSAWNPYEQTDFMARMIARGYGDHWTPILLGLC